SDSRAPEMRCGAPSHTIAGGAAASGPRDEADALGTAITSSRNHQSAAAGTSHSPQSPLASSNCSAAKSPSLPLASAPFASAANEPYGTSGALAAIVKEGASSTAAPPSNAEYAAGGTAYACLGESGLPAQPAAAHATASAACARRGIERMPARIPSAGQRNRRCGLNPRPCSNANE